MMSKRLLPLLIVSATLAACATQPPAPTLSDVTFHAAYCEAILGLGIPALSETASRIEAEAQARHASADQATASGAPPEVAASMAEAAHRSEAGAQIFKGVIDKQQETQSHLVAFLQVHPPSQAVRTQAHEAATADQNTTVSLSTRCSNRCEAQLIAAGLDPRPNMGSCMHRCAQDPAYERKRSCTTLTWLDH